MYMLQDLCPYFVFCFIFVFVQQILLIIIVIVCFVETGRFLGAEGVKFLYAKRDQPCWGLNDVGDKGIFVVFVV